MARLYKLSEINVLTVYVVLLIVSKCVDTQRLNVPRALLPIFNDFPVNFTLEVTEGGCYKWTTTRLDLIRLIPLHENSGRTCSSSVMVQPVTKDSTRNTAIILAEDISTGQFLRCDVIVDAISSLNLVTTTRELFIEEAPEAFEVRAYDDQGNEFTTLAGVEFSWTIGSVDKRTSRPDSKKPSNNVLRFMTFRESPYETPPTVAKLDSSGKRGHVALLEGVRTGSAKVSVKLPYSEYEQVPPIEVELIVIANLIVLPSDVTVMAYDTLNYRVMQVQQGRLEEISLPSPQYFLESGDPDILKIDNDRVRGYALAHGKTKMVLHDRNVDEDYGVVLPSATVHIKQPTYLGITVLPDRNWGLILGEKREIALEIYDNKDHKFHIGDGVVTSIRVDEKYFDVERSTTRNGSHIVVVPVATGITLVEASLLAVVNNEGKRIEFTSPLTASAELTIHPPVVIQPKILAVPVDPQSKSQFQVSLKASGGDGAYIWSSEQPSIASVSQNGVARILQTGSANVIVSMARNQYNRDAAKVYALVPSRLEIIKYEMEAAVGESIHLHVAMYGETNEGSESQEMPFNDCNDIPLDVYISDATLVQNYTDRVEPIGIACTTLSLSALTVGISGITIAYRNKARYLTDNVTISVYEPLVALHPSNGETLLAVGSSRRIVFGGGPRPSFGSPEGYHRALIASHPDTVTAEEEDYGSNVYVYNAVCRGLGESVLTLSVSNAPLLPNCRRTEASVSVRVTCGKPRYIGFQPVFRDAENCPIARNTDRIVARSREDLELTVLVKDQDGRTFENATSLEIEWTLDPARYGKVEKLSGLMEETVTEMHVILPKRHYQRVLSEQRTGTVQVRASVAGYRTKILAEHGITPEWPAFPVENERGVLATPDIRASIDVTLVNDTVIAPNRLKILNDPEAKYSLQVNHGSGYFQFVLSSEDVADVTYVEPTRTISVVPKRSGTLRVALADLCLDSAPAEAIVKVQQLGAIDVEVVTKIEKGKCVTAALRFYDTEGHPMRVPSVDALNVRVETENGFVEAKRLPNEEQKRLFEEILYMIYGVEEGETRLRFVSGVEHREIRSEPATIQVFLPLKITPRNATILISSIYQINTIGGPTNCEIEFGSENEDKIGVDSFGFLEGKSLGEATIFARAIGPSPKGKRVVYSQDSIRVRVILLEGVKIVAPIVRVKVGGTLPLWAFGIPEPLTPLVIGSTRLPLKFSWSTSDEDVLELRGVYEDLGIDAGQRNDVSLRGTAKKSGSVTIRLNVTVPCELLANCDSNAILATFLKLETFEELRLIDHEGIANTVVSMAPNSALKLETNRDKYATTSYEVVTRGNQGTTEDSNALTRSTSTVRVDGNGVLTSGENYGKTVVLVTSVEPHGLKQTLSVIVDVKPVYYMMIELASKLKIRPGEELDALPKGMKFEYVVRYYDNVGTRFHAAESSLAIATSRADLATFSVETENKFVAKFLRAGKMIAKVFDDQHPNAMFDYVNATIEDILFPSPTKLTVGDVVCFSMPLLSSDGEPGYWQSSNVDLLTIDAITGVARALNPGQVFVKHSLATVLQGDIGLTIEPIAEISFVNPYGKNVTGTEMFSAALILRSSSQLWKKNNILSRSSGGCRVREDPNANRCPYTCAIDFPARSSTVDAKDSFVAKPRFDIANGFYYCDVVPIGPPTKISSTIDTSIRIFARSRDVEATPLIVSHLPAVYVSPREVTFAPVSSTPTKPIVIDVHGIPIVLAQLSIRLPEGLSISGPQMISETLARFKIRLMHDPNELQGAKIRVISQLTEQDVPILVRVSTHDTVAPISGINWLDYVYYHRYTFGTFLTLVLTIFYFYKSKTMSIDVLVKNKSIFADRCPPPMKKTASPSSPNANNTSGSRSPGSPGSNTSLRPFSAFEPVYGDPRGYYTPNARRNRSQINT